MSVLSDLVNRFFPKEEEKVEGYAEHSTVVSAIYAPILPYAVEEVLYNPERLYDPEECVTCPNCGHRFEPSMDDEYE